MADDRIELKLEIDGEEQAAELASSAEQLDEALKKVFASATKVEAATQKKATATKAAAAAVVKQTEAELELEHAAQLEAMAIEHEIATLKHEQEQLDAVIRAENAQIDAIGRQVNAENKAADAVTKKTKATTAGSDAAGLYRQRMTGLSYSLNDFFGVSGDLSQRLNAIANNLPMLLAGFGGIGLAVSGLVPIFALAIRNWDVFGSKIEGVLAGIVGSENWELIKKRIHDAFAGSVKEAVDRVDALKAKIKELEEKPNKVVMDFVELTEARKEADRLAEGLKLIERLRKHQTEQEKESGETAEKAITESAAGPEKITRDLTEQFRRELMATRTNRPGELGVTDRQIVEKEKELRAKHGGDFGGDEDALKRYISENRDIKALEQKRANQEADIAKPGGLAEAEAGKAIGDARDLGGKAQA